MAGRPTLIRGNSQLFFPGMGRLSENSVVSIKNKSFSVTAEVDVPDGGAEGVIIAQGGRFGGWAVYAKDGRAKFVYNVSASTSSPPRPTPRSRPAPTRCAWSSPTTAAASPRAATSPCTTTATRSAPDASSATQPMIFSADETTDIGYESGTTVTPDYTAHGSRFTGKIRWVQLDLDRDDLDARLAQQRVGVGVAVVGEHDAGLDRDRVVAAVPLLALGLRRRRRRSR